MFLFETDQLNCKILPEPHIAKSTGRCDYQGEKDSGVGEGAHLLTQPNRKEF